MKLNKILKNASNNRIRYLASELNIQFSDFINNIPGMIRKISSTLSSTDYCRKILAKTGEEEKELLSFIASEGGELEYREIIERYFGNEDTKNKKIIKSVIQTGIAFEHSLEIDEEELKFIVIPEPILDSVPVAHFQRYKLGTFTAKLKFAELNTIITDGFGFSFKYDSRVFLSYFIRKHLLNPLTLKIYVDKLSKDEKSVLDFLMSFENNTLSVKEILKAPRISKKALDKLIFPKGLVYYVDDKHERGGETVVLPNDIYALIRNGFKKTTVTRRSKVTDVLETNPDNISIVKDNQNNILGDIKTFLGYCYGKRLKILKSGRLSKNTLRTVASLFAYEKEPDYAAFIFDFSIGKELLTKNNGCVEITDKAKTWEKSSVFSRMKDIYIYWLQVSEQTKRSNFLNTRKEKNALIEKIKLTGLDVGRWINYERFYRLYFEKKETSDSLEQVRKFLMSSGESQKSLFYKICIYRGLYYIGFLKIGNPSYFENGEDSKGAFMVTPLCKSVLFDSPQIIKELDQPGESSFIAQPNLEIVSPPSLDFDIFLELCRFADIKTTSTTAIFSFSKDSVRRGIDSGLVPADIIHFLENHSKVKVPQIYMDIVNDCKEKYGKIFIGLGGKYLLTSDELTMKELKAQKEFKDSFIRSLSPVAEIMDPGCDIEKFVNILHEKGYMPEVEETRMERSEIRDIPFSLKPDDFFVLRDAVKVLLKVIYEHNISKEYLTELRNLDDKFWQLESEYGEPGSSTFFRDFYEELKKIIDRKSD